MIPQNQVIVLAQNLMEKQLAHSQNIEIGYMKEKNADGSWNIQLKGRGDYLYGVNYTGSLKLALKDYVTIGFLGGDRQRPFIMGLSGYRSGETISIYSYPSI